MGLHPILLLAYKQVVDVKNSLGYLFFTFRCNCLRIRFYFHAITPEALLLAVASFLFNFLIFLYQCVGTSTLRHNVSFQQKLSVIH